MGVTTARVQWLDVARGIAILLVVLYHSALLLEQADLTVAKWHRISATLSTFRMPLFFFASGILASSAMARSWGSLWTRRLSVLAWVFLLWSVIRFVYYSAFHFEGREFEANPMTLLLAPITPTTGLWFLHVLFFFLIAARLLAGRISPTIQIVVFALVSALFLSVIDLESLSYNGMGRYFVFFLVGIYGKQIAIRLASVSKWWWGAAALMSFAALAYLIEHEHLDAIIGLRFLAAVLALIAGTFVSAALVHTPLRRPLAYLGRNTLPIYVTHLLLVSVLILLAGFLPEAPYRIRALLPFVVAGVATAGSLAVRYVLVRLHLGVVFSPPKWFSRERALEPQPTLAG